MIEEPGIGIHPLLKPFKQIFQPQPQCRPEIKKCKWQKFYRKQESTETTVQRQQQRLRSVLSVSELTVLVLRI